MHYSSVLALTGLTLATAAPTTTARAEGTWTLRSFVRTCDDAANSCTYDFAVVDDVSGRYDACHFTDVGDETREARWSSPSNLECSAAAPIYVNIGYDQPGNFFVVVPVNTDTNRDAFFGYTADELADGNVVTPDHTSPSQDAGAAGMKAAAKVNARATAEDLGQWTVEGLHRSKS